ncbi:Mur ligase domain-containing protein, partial [Campylobacter jejuni]|nr:Mur ligase domain-containing protein [Campylobacter jejuni]
MMQNIHFIGIGGIGISALARFLKEKGLKLAEV